LGKKSKNDEASWVVQDQLMEGCKGGGKGLVELRGMRCGTSSFHGVRGRKKRVLGETKGGEDTSNLERAGGLQ